MFVRSEAGYALREVDLQSARRRLFADAHVLHAFKHLAIPVVKGDPVLPDDVRG
jgi:hypothetical protein